MPFRKGDPREDFQMQLNKGGRMKGYRYIPLALLVCAVFARAQTVDEHGGVQQSAIQYEHNGYVPFDPPGWSNDTILSDNDAAESIYPDIELDPRNHIHVVWKDNHFSTNGIFYRKYDGVSWSTTMDLSDPGINSNSPTIAVDNENNVHVVFLRWSGVPYAHYNVSYKRFDDSTGFWSAESVITTDDSLGLSARPKVVTDSNLNVYVFWLDERDVPLTIWYKVHDGNSWSADMAVTDSFASPNGYFGVTVSPNDNVHVSWQDYRGATAEIYHKYYNGSVWSAEEAVTNNGFLSVYPRMAPDSADNIHMFYGGATHLRYLMWDSQTHTWGNGQDFQTQFTSPHADIAVDLLTDDIHVVFADYLGYSAVFYKKFDASSNQWEPDLQLTTTTSGSYEPQVATDVDNLVYLVWYDYRCGTGQEEVFFKHSLTTGIHETPGDPAPIKVSVYPNPFISSVELQLHYESEKRRIGESEIHIYDSAGRRVRKISLFPSCSVRESFSNGVNISLGAKATWDGTDEKGTLLPSGVYFYKLISGEVISEGKLIKLR
jgi:hypothetical protein